MVWWYNISFSMPAFPLFDRIWARITIVHESELLFIHQSHLISKAVARDAHDR